MKTFSELSSLVFSLPSRFSIGIWVRFLSFCCIGAKETYGNTCGTCGTCGTKAGDDEVKPLFLTVGWEKFDW